MNAILDNEYMRSSLANFIENYFTNFGDNTVSQYRRIYSNFEDWMSERKKDAPTCTKADALGYLKHLKNSDLSDRTIKKYFIVLNRIYRAAVEFEEIEKNPWPPCKTAISWRRVNDRRPTKYISPKAVDEILKNDKSESLDPVRDQAILAVLFGVGLRRSEVCKLKLSSIMVTHRGTIFIEIKNPKGGKTRRHSVPLWAWKYLSALVAQRKRQGATDSDYCFITAWSVKHISPEQLYRIFKRWTKNAPHSARASYGTQLLLQGHSFEAVARALGHANSDQVKVYQKRELSVDDCCGKEVDYWKKSVDAQNEEE